MNCGAPAVDKRYRFTGVWTYVTTGTVEGWWNKDCLSARVANNPGKHCTIEFNFIGAKLRILMQTHPERCKKVDVFIDGAFAGSYTIASEMEDMALLYEKTGLSYNLHYVKIYGDDPEHGLNFDCIDIDAEGEVPEFKEPERYILQENESYRTIIGTELAALENQNLTIENVLANGFYAPEQIREVYKQLHPSFKLLRYAMASANDAVRFGHLPDKQLVIPSDGMDMSGYSTINQMAVSTRGSAGTVKLVFSFDRGTSWKTYENDGWKETSLDVESVALSGMTVENIANIQPDKWRKAWSGSLQIAFCLIKSSTTDDMAVDTVTIYGDTSYWMFADKSDYTCSYPGNAALQVRLLKDGSYKVNWLKQRATM